MALSRDPRVGPLQVISRYLPAEREQILAGAFTGVVVQPDGDVALMVGDVSGHGPDAAAVATHLRAAWRGLAVAGVPAYQIIRVLNDSLMAESMAGGGVRFATVCLASSRRPLAGDDGAGRPPAAGAGHRRRNPALTSHDPVLGSARSAGGRRRSPLPPASGRC